MEFELRSRGVVLGRVLLEYFDRAAGIGHGVFAPSAEYQSVKPVFDLLDQARTETDAAARDRLLERHYAEAAALALRLYAPRGEHWPTHSILVGAADSSARLEIEVRFQFESLA